VSAAFKTLNAACRDTPEAVPKVRARIIGAWREATGYTGPLLGLWGGFYPVGGAPPERLPDADPWTAIIAAKLAHRRTGGDDKDAVLEKP